MMADPASKFGIPAVRPFPSKLSHNCGLPAQRGACSTYVQHSLTRSSAFQGGIEEIEESGAAPSVFHGCATWQVSVANYWEALGVMMAHKAGVDHNALRAHGIAQIPRTEGIWADSVKDEAERSLVNGVA